MSRGKSGPQVACLLSLLAISLGACGSAQRPPILPEPSPMESARAVASQATPTSTALPATLQLAPTEPFLPTVAVTATALPTRVVVTAAKGNVFIRRGPDFAFNAIDTLMQGESAKAVARDVLAEWLEIPLPDDSGKMGWISIQSQFTSVDGNVAALPEIQPDYFPVGASVRNCTLHQMLLTPGGITLPSLLNFPYNDVTVNPGVYKVIDTDIDSYPSVARIDVQEGSAIDINVDGNGNKKKCPVP